MAAMTSRQRVLTACRHEEPDRVPLQVYLTPEIRAGLQAHFGDCDIFEALGIDLRHVGAPYMVECRPGPGLLGKAYSYDLRGAGCTRTQYQGGAYSEATELPFAEMDSLDEVEACPWPSPDDYDYSTLRERSEIVGAGGGYILSPAHCIQPDTPVENVLALYDEALSGGLTP